MSDRDRLARVVALELVRQAREASDYQNRDCYKVADALIAAGVTMPAPPCEHGVSAYCPACGKCNCASCNDDGGGFW